MVKSRNFVMKSKQLLSIVFALIMFTGVTTGNAVFAQSDDDMSESLEVSTNDDGTVEEEHDDERVEDDEHDDEKEEHDDSNEDKEDDKREYTDDKEGKHVDLDDRLESFCEMTEDEKTALFADHPRFAEFEDRLANYCSLETHDEREDAIEAFIKEHIPEVREHDDYKLDDLLDRFCAASDEDKEKLFLDFPRFAQFSDRLANYCEMSEEEQDVVEDLLENYKDEIRINIKEHAPEFKMDHDKDMRERMDKYCEMPDEDKSAFLAEHDKAEDHAEKMNQYCQADEEGRIAFIAENREEHKETMMEMKEKKSHDMDYDRLCSLSESERASEIDDAEKLGKISNWCEMTPEEREEYKKEHHKSKDHDKSDKHEKMKAKLSEKSMRLKEMIMDKRDISDEKREEIKMKYIEKHGDLDEKKSELKMKFKEHMVSKRINMSEERRSEIHDRLSEMKAFKAELREKSSELTDEEKQTLREEFIEKAKELQLAWISPRTQMNAGVTADDIECREGFSLVMKESNGVPMCLKSQTALKMIERGIAVPAN